MTRCIFRTGFNWKVVEYKWNGFEEAFEGFIPARRAGVPFKVFDVDTMLAYLEEAAESSASQVA